MSEIEVITSSWDFVVLYDMDTYFAMLEKGTNLIQKMRSVCYKLHDFEDHCNLVLNNI